MNRTAAISEGCRRLRAWMDRSKLTNQVEAARVIGISYYYFNKIYLGIRVPGRDTAVQIEKETGVPVEAWASIRLDKIKRATVTSGRNS